MKKRVWLVSLMAIVLLFSLLAGCGRTDALSKSYESYDEGAAVSSYDYVNDYDYAVDNGVGMDAAYEEETAEESASGEEITDAPALSQKIIYSADISMETTDFEGTLSAVERMVSDMGGFLEDSYIEGSSYETQYYGYDTCRTASYTIRVPSEKFEALTGGFSDIGQVTNLHRYTENVTSQFTDLQSRLDAYETEEEALLGMLEKGETVTELIEVETRLSEVRYQIEYYTSTMRNLQNEVDYSTVSLNIYEVTALSMVVEPDLTYWQKIGQGMVNSLESIGRFFSDLFMGIASNLPVLVLVFGILAVVVWLCIRGIRKTKRALAAQKHRTENLTESDNHP